MMRQAAAHGLVVDSALPTPTAPDIKIEPLPPQHDSFDKTWQDLSTRLKLITEAVRLVGPETLGPGGERLKVRLDVMLHPCLVDRLGRRCKTVFSETDIREADYLPTNVKADTLPVFKSS
jgi:hypothetical protein